MTSHLTLKDLTLREQIGQMLLFGWQSDTQADALVDEFAVGGIIFMGRNIGTAQETRERITRFQAQAKARELPPLLITVDQEGGRVQRLAAPHFPTRPAAREIGLTGDPQRAREAAREIGQELAALGFNGDFAPVLDVDNNPRNPVIGDRSYGPDPEQAALLGAAAVCGFQEDAGIFACGKHFPGHGDTDTDSHHALPRIPHDRTRLDQIELVPFRAAIAAGLSAIMTAHILFPALDADRPATLSPAILTGLLRGEMDFDGLIITDDLEMHGVAAAWGAAEAAVLAVQAGADILLCCHTGDTQRAIQAALMQAVETGRLPLSRLEESCRRIARAKARWASPFPQVR